jgi:acetyl-CoA carboxylase carboxyl transferase subunit beta
VAVAPGGRSRKFPSTIEVDVVVDLDEAPASRETMLDRPGFVPPIPVERLVREVVASGDAAGDPEAGPPPDGDGSPASDVDGQAEGPADAGYEPPSPEELYERYEALVRSAARPDAEFFAQQVFADVVPLYNAVVIGDKLQYPSVIASIGRLGPQRFLVIGGQASYQRSVDGLRRVPASPAPADYEYLERMLDLGARWELPLVYLTDTLGAKPTIAGEEQNQMYRIARAIARGVEYPFPVLTVVTGALGSGGGLTLGPNADWFAMLDGSLAFVAEARSAASILYKTSQPSKEQVMQTLATMRATAWDQKDLKLIDQVVPEDGDPYRTAANVHRALVAAYAQLAGLSTRQLRSRRDKRLRSPGGLKVKRQH